MSSRSVRPRRSYFGSARCSPTRPFPPDPGPFNGEASVVRGTQEPLHRRDVERWADHHDQVVGTRVEVRRPGVDLAGIDGDRALDLARLAVEARAPIVEHPVLLREAVR